MVTMVHGSGYGKLGEEALLRCVEGKDNLRFTDAAIQQLLDDLDIGIVGFDPDFAVSPRVHHCLWEAWRAQPSTKSST